MRPDFFDYPLPESLIAQEPVTPRDAARLLVVPRAKPSLEHRTFRDLPELLAPGDLLVLNDTRVVPARLLGRRERTGGKWEGLFLRAAPDGTWELLCQTRGRLHEGEMILIETPPPGPLPEAERGGKPSSAPPLRLGEGVGGGVYGRPLRLTLLRQEEGHWFARTNATASPLELLEQHGRVPLPPYIRKGQARDEDRARYQTVYARQAGAVAAPTAGLHFTPEVFARLDERGISRAFVTLHVGVGTFQPIKGEDITQHRMHREWGELPAATAEAIADCRSRGNRIVAVGTTAVRVLETVAAGGPVRPWHGETDLFIYPPYAFRCVDALVTNFHLPRSTLLLLVAAFAGVELTHQAYRTAIEQQYRFFSYGDAMLIL